MYMSGLGHSVHDCMNMSVCSVLHRLVLYSSSDTRGGLRATQKIFTSIYFPDHSFVLSLLK